MKMNRNLIANQYNYDLTMLNYMALLACILNPKLSVSSSLRLLSISNNYEIDNKKSYKNYRKVKVIDIVTSEEFIYDSIYEAESYTGIKKENIYVYIKRNIRGKRRFKFSYLNSTVS